MLTPDGKPAAGAKLAMGIPGAQISVRNGDVGDSSTYAARVETDKSGKFHFPPQDGAITLVVTHPSGYAKIASGRRVETGHHQTGAVGTRGRNIPCR